MKPIEPGMDCLLLPGGIPYNKSFADYMLSQGTIVKAICQIDCPLGGIDGNWWEIQQQDGRLFGCHEKLLHPLDPDSTEIETETPSEEPVSC